MQSLVWLSTEIACWLYPKINLWLSKNKKNSGFSHRSFIKIQAFGLGFSSRVLENHLLNITSSASATPLLFLFLQHVSFECFGYTPNRLTFHFAGISFSVSLGFTKQPKILVKDVFTGVVNCALATPNRIAFPFAGFHFSVSLGRKTTIMS